MNKKFLIGLAPLLVTAAFVVMPAVSQGAFETCTAPNCPHVYKNGVVGTANVKVRGIAWGNLKLHNEKLNDVECHNIFGGFAVNPAGGGAATGEAQAFYPYECNDKTCTEKLGTIIVQPGKLPWKGEAEQSKPNEFWGKSGFKGPTPKEEPTEPGYVHFFVNCTAITEAFFFGENDAFTQNNGVAVGSAPGEIQLFHEGFGPAGGCTTCVVNLETKLIGPGETEGKLKGQGYGGQELLEVHNP
jgi:hypothetical protein